MIKSKLKLLTIMILTASLLLITSCSDNKDTVSEKDLLTEITSVSVSTNPIITSQPVIIQRDGGHVIEFAVAPTATAEDLKLALIIVLPNDNCSVSPASGEIVDFSKEVTYTVTNKVGKTTKQYRVICNKDKHEGALITSFLIDETNFTKLVSQPELKSGNYEFTVSETTTTEDVKALVPIIEISEGATISPASGVAQDFTSPIVYTVMAENGIKNEYIVICIKKQFEGALMLSMEFKENALVETQPVITESEGVVFYLHPEAAAANMTTLTPTITISEGAAISPASGVAQDFTNPVVYTVTAENGVENEYVVTCIRRKYAETKILSMQFADNALVETQPVITDDAIVFYLFAAATPEDIAALTPTITLSKGATINPASEVAQDFTNPVTYTVTAENEATKEYTVTCVRNKYTESKLLSLGFDSPLITVEPVIADGSLDIEFYVSGDASLAEIAALSPVTQMSTGATISTSKPHVPGAVVEYVVTAENGQTTTYNVVCKRVNVIYQFEQWVESGTGYKWREDPIGWCSSNEGAGAIPTFQGPTFPISRNVDGRNGIGVNILTIETKYSALFGVPKVTSGSMYLGAFIVDMKNKLNSTKFGIEFHEKPLKVRGYYKYTASTNYWYNNVAAPADTETDKMTIRAVLYEVDDYSETLTGLDISDSDKIVAVAYMSDGAEKTEFTEFELTLDYNNANGRTYDPAKKYKFSIIFASSDRGDIFYGGLGSIMVVDDVEVVLE